MLRPVVRYFIEILEYISSKNFIAAIENPHFKMFSGSFNRKDDRLARGWPKNADFILGQSHCIVVVAWMYTFKYRPYEWREDHLDNIVIKGDWLHFMALCDNEKEPKAWNDLMKIRAGLLSVIQFLFG